MNAQDKLTKSDVTKTYLRWWWTAELSNSFERMQALAFAASMAPALKKLYVDKEDLKAALKRHLAFFNTQAIWGALVIGSSLALEEQKAHGEKIPDEVITSTKTGLMGPLAGIGDSLDFGTIQTIFFSLAASFAVSGNLIGAAFIVTFSVLHFCLGYFFVHTGYEQGKKSIVSVLNDGRITRIIQTASMLGMIMMGALSASMIKLSTTLQFLAGGSQINVRATLDKIVPGILPLIAVLSVFWALKYKKTSLGTLMLILTAVSLVGALIGVL